MAPPGLWLFRIIALSLAGVLSMPAAIAVTFEHPIQTERSTGPRDLACDFSTPFLYEITDFADFANWCKQESHKQDGLADDLSYLLQTAHPGDTMNRQGPEVALRLLHPEFVRRL